MSTRAELLELEKELEPRGAHPFGFVLLWVEKRAARQIVAPQQRIGPTR